MKTAILTLSLLASLPSPAQTKEPMVEDSRPSESEIAQAHKLLSAVQLGGNTETIKKLLDSGIDVNARAEAGVTAYHAARMLGDLELAQYLAQHGANTNIPIPAPDQLADALFAHFILTNGPGAAVLVAQNGTVLFERG